MTSYILVLTMFIHGTPFQRTLIPAGPVEACLIMRGGLDARVLMPGEHPELTYVANCVPAN